MANDCWYQMCAVGPKESLERLIRIMNYEDPKLFIYRVFSVEMNSDIKPIDDERYSVYLAGDVAWSISSWIKNTCEIEGKDKRLFVNLRFLSELLHIDFEIQSEESGCAFQQHCAIVNGEVKMYQDCPWFDLYYSKDDYEDVSEIIEDINRIILKYDDIKKTFYGNDLHKKMVDEIYDFYDEHNYLAIELGGYGRDTVVGDDIIDGDVKEWQMIPYEIFY